jgi:Fe-S-cluster-containing hydrogenase component 2
MEIDKDKCVGCGNCHAVCTMGAIYLEEDGKSAVNQDECVECNTCYRVCGMKGIRRGCEGPSGKSLWLSPGIPGGGGRCPTGARACACWNGPEPRAAFSGPRRSIRTHRRRGTEIKSNDGLTDPQGKRIVVEMGRPGIGPPSGRWRPWPWPWPV